MPELRFFARASLALCLFGCGSSFSLSPSDGGAQGDASADDGSAADGGAGGSGFCASQTKKHFLCDDFDEGNDVKAGWDTIVTSAAESLAYDSNIAASPPRSAQAQTTSAFSNLEQDAYLAIKIGSAVVTTTLSFDIYVESYGGEADGGASDKDSAVIAAWSIGPASYLLTFNSQKAMIFGELYSPDGGMPQLVAHPANQTIATKRWTHVDVSLTFPRPIAKGRITVKIDGASVLDFDGSLPPTPGDVQFLLGLILSNTAMPWNIRYDNVIIDKL